MQQMLDVGWKPFNGVVAGPRCAITDNGGEWRYRYGVAEAENMTWCSEGCSETFEHTVVESRVKVMEGNQYCLQVGYLGGKLGEKINTAFMCWPAGLKQDLASSISSHPSL